MKKIVITSLILFSAICAGKAQSYETSVEIDKSFQNAVCVDLAYTVKDVETALEKRFAASGLKSKSFKGFTEYKGVKFSDFTYETITIYTKVEKNKSSKAESKVYILINMPDGQFCSSATCEHIIANVKKFANNLEPYVELYTTTVLLDKRTDELKKAEKDLKNLQEDRDKLLKKIDENTKNIQSKENEVSMKRQILNETQSKKIQQETDLPK